jgi:hypothetical protein
MLYYDSKHLSQRLKVNPAKWKRWARTFLPPDPLGGLQSGVARQFNIKDAFKVYLGGYLVGELKFSIPDAVQILNDLSNWLKMNGYLSIQPQFCQEKNLHNHVVYIFQKPEHKFGYCVRTILSSDADEQINTEVYLQTLISVDHDLIVSGEAKSASLLSITSLYKDFLNHLD